MTTVEAIGIGASLLEGDAHITTFRAGLIGRAAAAYRVRRIVVFPESPAQEQRASTLHTLLAYQATAPYLRKRLWPMQEELRMAAHLPVLNSATHDVGLIAIRGEVRQAVILDSGADIGLPELATVAEGDHLKVGAVVDVRVAQNLAGRVTVKPLAPDAPAGHRVDRARDLSHALKWLPNAVHASRRGTPMAEIQLPESISLVFGGPLGLEGREEVESLPTVNVVPGQGTRSIRTEEAVWSGLSAFRALHVEGAPDATGEGE